ncbi:MAG: hypothetical protein AB7L65_00965 [Hyphomonadaceae bacterium]
MKRSALALLGATLAACSQPAQETDAPAAAAPAQQSVQTGNPGCAAAAQRLWQAAALRLTIEARLAGPACDKMIAVLSIRDGTGRPLYADAAPIAAIPLAFNPQADEEAMTRDVAAWISGSGQPATARALPAWRAGSAAPPPAFFAMIDRAAYEAARAEAWPLFCYPNGAESAACVAADVRRGTVLRLGDLRPEAAP